MLANLNIAAQSKGAAANNKRDKYKNKGKKALLTKRRGGPSGAPDQQNMLVNNLNSEFEV